MTYHCQDAGEDAIGRYGDGRWAFRTTRYYPAYPDYALEGTDDQNCVPNAVKQAIAGAKPAYDLLGVPRRFDQFPEVMR